MANVERTATTVWEGDLAHGNGVLSLKSGAAPDLPVTWASRTERSDGKTSPEELIAAAHASCFSMALSHELAQAGNPPERLDVSATVTLVDGRRPRRSRARTSRCGASSRASTPTASPQAARAPRTAARSRAR